MVRHPQLRTCEAHHAAVRNWIDEVVDIFQLTLHMGHERGPQSASDETVAER